jgi:RNA polymerase sigma-70 factor (ECF subfamily)
MNTLALQELFDCHHNTILQSAFKITGNLDDAEDVLQTVFVRLAKREDQVDLDRKSHSYFRRAAVNAALDVVRSRKFSRNIPLEVVEEGLEGNAGQRPDRLGSYVELRSWLRSALAQLNPKAAEVFVLKFIEGYSNQEIADILGTTAGTVAVTIHRTRSRLKAEMKPFLGGKQ